MSHLVWSPGNAVIAEVIGINLAWRLQIMGVEYDTRRSVKVLLLVKVMSTTGLCFHSVYCDPHCVNSIVNLTLLPCRS